MEHDEKSPLVTTQIVVWDKRDYPSVYANLMQLNVGPFDLSVIFGEIKDATPEKVEGIPRVRLMISPEQASALMSLLQTGSEQYTGQFGPLRKTISFKAVESPR